MRLLAFVLALLPSLAWAQGGLPSNPSTTTGATPLPALAGASVYYFEGSSITRAPHASGAAVGSQLPGGGLSGNYGALLAASTIAGGATYYNDGVDGSTSTSMLARYTTGNSTYNSTTVPSPHSICTTATSAGKKAVFFVDTTPVNNDQQNSISLSTSVSNYNALYSAAHADGCTVIMLPTPGQNYGAGLTVNQDIRDGVISSDNWIDLAGALTDQTDANLWTSSHPTVLGHVILSRNLVRAITAGNDVLAGNPGTFTTPVTAPTVCVGGNSITGGCVSFSGAPLIVMQVPISCSLQYAYCSESAVYNPSIPFTVTSFQATFANIPAGCTNPGSLVLKSANGSQTYATLTLVNGTQSYSATGLNISITSSNGIQVAAGGTAASGCSTYPSGGYYIIEGRVS